MLLKRNIYSLARVQTTNIYYKSTHTQHTHTHTHTHTGGPDHMAMRCIIINIII